LMALRRKPVVAEEEEMPPPPEEEIPPPPEEEVRAESLNGPLKGRQERIGRPAHMRSFRGKETSTTYASTTRS
ncbi:MAG: hypothetical protein V3U09_01975, partial [Thermoplasmata archaeon]